MKADQTKFRIFNIMQYDLEEDFLRGMHQKGYAFENLTCFGLYSFVRVTPQDVIYKLDFPEDFHTPEDHDDYIQLYTDSGWEYLFDRYQYSYFRKPADGPNDDIFSDDQSKLAMINRIAKYRFLPGWFLFLILILVIPDSFGFASLSSTMLTVFWSALLIWVSASYYRLKKRIQKRN